MDRVTANIKDMYIDFPYGDFGCERREKNLDPLFGDFLSMVKKDNKIFDIGCGAGFLMGACVRRGISKDQIAGIDLSPKSVEIVKKNGFDASCGDVSDLRLEDNVSDFTICNGVILLAKDPFQAFKELVRITKPGGYIYLSVYNRWHPYFYLVHRATAPIRWYYWNRSRRSADIIYSMLKVLFRPLAYLVTREPWDDKKWKTVFMDQVIAPRACLFSKSTLSSYAKRCGCQIRQYGHSDYRLMLSSIIYVDT